MPLDSIATMIRGTTGIDPQNQELLTLTGSVADFSKDVGNYSAQLVWKLFGPVGMETIWPSWYECIGAVSLNINVFVVSINCNPLPKGDECIVCTLLVEFVVINCTRKL